MQLSVALKNAQLQAIGSALAGGSIAFYAGSAPANVGELTDQTELLTAQLPVPAYTSIDDGVMAMAALPETLITQAGELGFARCFDSAGTALVDLSVSGPAGSGDLKFPSDNLSLYAGAVLRLSTWSLSI